MVMSLQPMTSLGSATWLYYVDHTARFERNTGIQRCVRCLACALLELGRSLQPVVWDRPSRRLKPASLEERQHLARWGGPPSSAWADADRLARSPQELLQADQLLIVELVSGPHNPDADQLELESARLQLDVAWLFHDAIPWRLAALYGQHSASASQCHAQYMAGLARFPLVLANSRTTASHLREFWIEQRIATSTQLKVVRLAEEFPQTLRMAAADPQAPLMLCVGSLEPRKNHRGLLKALAVLVAQQRWPAGLTLVLIGWPNDAGVVAMVQRALALGLPFRWESDADDQRLLELYLQARCCVFPSLEEGFGLPVAESLWHRRPCLCRGDGALAELAAGGGCVMVETRDHEQLSSALHRLATNASLHQHLVQEIQNRPMRTWVQMAMEWRHLLEQKQ